MKESNLISRRNFIKTLTTTTIGTTALLSSGCSSLDDKIVINAKNSLIKKGNTILFQGDSITDSGRSRRTAATPNDANALGRGYVQMISAQLLAEYPADDLKIFNRGISGNKVFELAARWDTDCLDLKPDVLSILIGVNDIWHTLEGRYNGTIEKYENDYRELLERTLEALPDVKLVICEPFVLRCGAVNDTWFPEFNGYRASARKIAEEFDALFVPFQTMFDKALENTAPEYWAADGVHPTMAGAALMAKEWLKTVGI